MQARVPADRDPGFFHVRRSPARSPEESTDRGANRIPEMVIRAGVEVPLRRIHATQTWRKPNHECRGGTASPELFTPEYGATAGDAGVPAGEAGDHRLFPARVQPGLYRRNVY